MITVYTMIPPKHTASFYYRLQVPLETADFLGLPVRTVIDENSADMAVEDRVRAFSESDIVLLYQPYGPGPVQNIKGLQQIIPSMRDGEWKYAPSVIIETDDNLFNVSPLNRAYKTLGTRDMNGKDIPPGHHIGMSREGEKEILWADGEKGFSIAQNRQNMATYKAVLSMADAVQCSTPAVEAAVRREVHPRRTEVFPNLVRFDHYEQVDLVQDPNQLHILWQGGTAHYEDWYPLREALGNISKKYPHVHWDVWGAQFPWVKELIPPDQMTYHDWVPYQLYKLKLALMNHDIALAPLNENLFNECRSAIKMYEASVLKKDIPTLAQNSGAYKNEIIDGETGLLFNDPKEFEEKLSLLIENASERKRIGRNAKDWVHENRDAMKEVPRIISFWEQIREERKIEQPHVTDDHWKEIEELDRQELEAQSGAVPG